MKYAHVICSNDSVEHVHLGTTAEAHQQMEILAKEDYARGCCQTLNFKEYRKRIYWHIHTVVVTGC